MPTMHYHADCYGELVFHSAVEQYCRFYRATLCYIVVSAFDVVVRLPVPREL